MSFLLGLLSFCRFAKLYKLSVGLMLFAHRTKSQKHSQKWLISPRQQLLTHLSTVLPCTGLLEVL